MKAGAVVLAAGGSARFGQPKQLLLYDGEPLVRRVAGAPLKAGCAPVVVVTGRDEAKIIAALEGLPITCVPNESWERGIGSSIRVGLEALSDCDSVVLLLCDQPSVSAETISRLVAKAQESGKAIIASAYTGTIGVPAFFARKFFPALRGLPNECGAKSIIVAHPEEVATIDFPQGALDIDTPADYERALRPGGTGAGDR